MFPMLSTTHHYRLHHLAHHQFVNDPERDPNVPQVQVNGHWTRFPMTRAAFWRELAKQIWPVYLFRYLRSQAASNAMQLLASGFTVIRDVGNNAMYADTALRADIEQGWLPGPTVIPSGLIIGGRGGQFTPTPGADCQPDRGSVSAKVDFEIDWKYDPQDPYEDNSEFISGDIGRSQEEKFQSGGGNE